MSESMDRRRFLLTSGLVAAGAALVGPVRPAFAAVAGPGPYGALQAADANGLQLPAGFTSRIIGTTGTTVAGPNQEALPNIPPMDVHVGLRFRDPNQDRRWGVEITSRMVATQDQVATTLEEQITGGFTLFDIRSYWRPNNNMLFSAGIENLFNRQYREWADLRPSAGYTVFQPGFNAYVGLRLTY